MADNLKPPAGAIPPPPAPKIQPKKETVRISLPPKPAAKETVRLELPRALTAGGPPAPKPAAPTVPAAPKPPVPAAPAVPKPAAPAGAPPIAAKQTVRLSLPARPSAAKETVRLALPPRPAAGSSPSGSAKPGGGSQIKLVVPQVNETAVSAEIPDASEVMPTLEASPAPPTAGLKGGPPGSRPMSPTAGSSQPDSVDTVTAIKAPSGKPRPIPQPQPDVGTVTVTPSGVVVQKAGWPDYLLSILALFTSLAAVGRLIMIIGD